MAGWVQPAIFNPVDCLRIRWQVSVDETTFAKFTAELLRKEGLWQGLWRPGLPFNMCAVAVSQGLRMGLYPTARDALQTLLPSDGQKSSAAMIGAGLMSGSFAYFTGAPLWLVKTRMQAAVQFAADGASTAVQIYPVHLSDYWRGCSPLILRGALLTAGQMFGYDGTKTAGRRLGYKDGPVLHV
ncbi:ucpB, partial [Symbiodinium necroappetens]